MPTMAVLIIVVEWHIVNVVNIVNIVVNPVNPVNTVHAVHAVKTVHTVRTVIAVSVVVAQTIMEEHTLVIMDIILPQQEMEAEMTSQVNILEE